jgi:hypothetical protein
MFCSKKCISSELLFKIVQKELNVKFREKLLISHLKLYNVSINQLYLSIDEYGYGYEKIEKLKYTYVNNLNNWSLEKICQKFCELKYLYEYCNIQYYLQASEINNFSIQLHYEISKNMALNNKGGQFPIIWPWDYEIKILHKIIDDLAYLRILTNLEYFDISNCINITDDGLSYISEFKGLIKLIFCNATLMAI